MSKKNPDFSKKSKGYYTDIVFEERKDGKFNKIWLNGKKKVNVEVVLER